jgi:hypothetical protein
MTTQESPHRQEADRRLQLTEGTNTIDPSHDLTRDLTGSVMLEATIDVQITHASGRVIADGNHVRGWLTARLVPASIGDRFDSEVCSGHPNPNTARPTVAAPSLHTGPTIIAAAGRTRPRQPTTATDTSAPTTPTSQPPSQPPGRSATATRPLSPPSTSRASPVHLDTSELSAGDAWCEHAHTGNARIAVDWEPGGFWHKPGRDALGMRATGAARSTRCPSRTRSGTPRWRRRWSTRSPRRASRSSGLATRPYASSSTSPNRGPADWHSAPRTSRHPPGRRSDRPARPS